MLRCIFPLYLLLLAVVRCCSFVTRISSSVRLASIATASAGASSKKKPISRSNSGDSHRISGLYEYTGDINSIRTSGLPHEIVSFMEKTSKRHSKGAKKNGASKTKRKFTANTDTNELDLLELEKEVGRKYGSKSFHPSKAVRQPEPVLRSGPKKRSWVSALADKVQKRNTTSSAFSEPRHRSLFSGRPAKVPILHTEGAEQLHRTGFRLRPPPPVPPEVAQRALKKEARQKQLEEQQERKRAELRETNKKLFVPFSLHDPTSQTIAADSSALLANSTFKDVGIAQAKVTANLFKMGLTMPTHIQAAAIPAMLRGESVVLHAHTGSGKTLAYLLPLTGAIDHTSREVQCVIFAPSRELVQQIGAVASELFAGTPWRVQTLIGGVSIQGQVQRLRDHRPHILVATPGRLGEIVFHLEKLRLSGVRVVVVDEVDNMLQEPYVGDLEALMQATPLYNRRNVTAPPQDGSIGTTITTGSGDQPPISPVLWLASATSSAASVSAFADQYAGVGHWRTIAAQSEGCAVPASITHGLISCPKERAMGMLKRFLKAKPAIRSAVIFVNDPRRVMGVCKELEIAGIIAAPLHGDTSKDDRKEILMRIKDGRLKYVVATELAARGLDIPELSHVINFELPTDAQHYVHRTGRCGRAGRQGLVMNFANPDTKFVARRFGKQLGVRVRDCEVRDGRVFLKGE